MAIRKMVITCVHKSSSEWKYRTHTCHYISNGVVVVFFLLSWSSFHFWICLLVFALLALSMMGHLNHLCFIKIMIGLKKLTLLTTWMFSLNVKCEKWFWTHGNCHLLDNVWPCSICGTYLIFVYRKFSFFLFGWFRDEVSNRLPQFSKPNCWKLTE